MTTHYDAPVSESASSPPPNFGQIEAPKSQPKGVLGRIGESRGRREGISSSLGTCTSRWLAALRHVPRLPVSNESFIKEVGQVLIRRRGPDASSTLSGKCVGQFPAKRQEAKSGETRHHAPDQIWSRQPLNWRTGQLTGARSGRGGAVLPDRQAGHRRSATSCPSDSASDRG